MQFYELTYPKNPMFDPTTQQEFRFPSIVCGVYPICLIRLELWSDETNWDILKLFAHQYKNWHTLKTLCLIQQHNKNFISLQVHDSFWIIFKPFGHFATTAGNEILDTFSIGFTRENSQYNGFSCLVITQFQASWQHQECIETRGWSSSFRLCFR